MRATYSIPDSNLEDLLARLKKLATRAKRIKAPWLAVEFVDKEVREVKIKGKKTKVIFHNIVVTGETPKMAGWTFVATLDHTVVDNTGTKAGVVIRPVPGETVPAEFRCSDATCDHCGVKRLRNETFVVRHDDGRIQRVGRQCLRDFLGHQDPHLLASWAKLLSSFDETMQGGSDFEGGWGASFTYTTDYLLCVAAIIRTVGWVSGGTARDTGRTSTATMASDLLWREQNGRLDPTDPRPIDADRSLVDAALEWINGVRAEQRDDLEEYLHNLTVVCASDIMPRKSAGLIASLIVAYQKAKEKEINRARWTNLKATSDYVGTPKKRMPLEVTVMSAKTRAGHYGPKTTVMMTDGTNAFTWFATGVPEHFEVGAKLKITARVEDHKEFNEVKTTYVSRATVVEVVEAA